MKKSFKTNVTVLLLASSPAMKNFRGGAVRPGFIVLAFLLLAGVLNAATIGLSVNGTCEAGGCPPTPLPFSSADSLPVNISFTLANGDQYLINGSFSGNNNSNGSVIGADYLFQVTYEGNGAGGNSAADSIAVQEFEAFQTTLASGSFFDTLVGVFSPTIAASSSAGTCVNGTLGCLGPVTPPGSFNLTSPSYSINSSGGAFVYNETFTSVFGAGSPVGSYVLWGQTTAAPEPVSFGLITLGLSAIFVVRRFHESRGE